MGGLAAISRYSDAQKRHGKHAQNDIFHFFVLNVKKSENQERKSDLWRMPALRCTVHHPVVVRKRDHPLSEGDYQWVKPLGGRQKEITVRAGNKWIAVFIRAISFSAFVSCWHAGGFAAALQFLLSRSCIYPWLNTQDQC